MTPSPKFKGQILRQVYRVWLVRKLLPILVVEVFLLTMILYKFAQRVFVERVVDNASHVLFEKPSGIFYYLFAAFRHTPLATKLFSIGIVLLVVLFLRHVTQGFLRFILVRQNFFGKDK